MSQFWWDGLDSNSWLVSGFREERKATESYEYDLIGVTVHTGTADGGHYYSFIRDIINPYAHKNNKWWAQTPNGGRDAAVAANPGLWRLLLLHLQVPLQRCRGETLRLGTAGLWVLRRGDDCMSKTLFKNKAALTHPWPLLFSSCFRLKPTTLSLTSLWTSLLRRLAALVGNFCF